MTNDLQVWRLILEASWLVQGVMVLLLVASVASWMIIFRKRQALNKAVREANAFEERFWSGTDLIQLHESIAASHRAVNGMERIFDTGFREFNRMREQARMSAGAMVEGAQRAMRITLTRETEDLEHHLNFLATVGSTSPYIGLFGTVWGIMTSFHQLANVNQATIAMVAPGISEATVSVTRWNGSMSDMTISRKNSPASWSAKRIGSPETRTQAMHTARKRRRPMAEINVVPYIDVMLVLLVIFMITAPLLNLGVEVELPKADAEPMDTEENQEPLVITVLENGDLYLNAGGDLDGTSSGLIDPETLVDTVSAIVRRNPDIQVLVGGDERVDYGRVYEAMVLLQKAKVQKVGLMSDPLDTGQGGEQDEAE
jgi:biopolymer transport protein TolQ